MNKYIRDGYSYNLGLFQNSKKWLKNLNDNLALSEISLPGTHDTMTYTAKQIDGAGLVKCQSYDLATQLNAGIRYIDIRCRVTDGSFAIHHGPYYLGMMFGDVINTVVNFLRQNPSEFVLMRVRQEYSEETDDVFSKIFETYYNKNLSFMFDSNNGVNRNPQIKEIRGKIVILRDFSGSSKGISYHNLIIQDDFEPEGNEVEDKIYNKWEKVKSFFGKANASSRSTPYLNHLSATNSWAPVQGGLPFKFASGQEDPADGANLDWRIYNHELSDFPDFPIINNHLYMTGINMLATAYIEENNPYYVGIVVSDFPGNTLINNIIGCNYDDQFFKTIQIDKITFNNPGEYGDPEPYGYLAMDIHTTSNQILSRKIWIQRVEVDDGDGDFDPNPSFSEVKNITAKVKLPDSYLSAAFYGDVKEYDVDNADDRLVDTSEYEYVQTSNVELNGESGANSVILEGINISGTGEVTVKVEVDMKLFNPGEGSGHDIFEFYASEGKLKAVGKLASGENVFLFDFFKFSKGDSTDYDYDHYTDSFSFKFSRHELLSSLTSIYIEGTVKESDSLNDDDNIAYGGKLTNFNNDSDTIYLASGNLYGDLGDGHIELTIKMIVTA